MYLNTKTRSTSRDFLAHNLNKGKLGSEKRKSLKKAKKSIPAQDATAPEKKKMKKTKAAKGSKKNE